MTIDQVIAQVDELKPNQVTRADKIKWLSRLDRRIFEQVISRHEKEEGAPDAFPGYGQDTPPDTELLAPPPYDEVYRFYLEMHIDLVNQELDKYNNSAALYASAWGQLARAWHREHRPLDTKGAAMRF